MDYKSKTVEIDKLLISWSLQQQLFPTHYTEVVLSCLQSLHDKYLDITDINDNPYNYTSSSKSLVLEHDASERLLNVLHHWTTSAQKLGLQHLPLVQSCWKWLTSFSHSTQVKPRIMTYMIGSEHSNVWLALSANGNQVFIANDRKVEHLCDFSGDETKQPQKLKQAIAEPHLLTSTVSMLHSILQFEQTQIWKWISSRNSLLEFNRKNKMVKQYNCLFSISTVFCRDTDPTTHIAICGNKSVTVHNIDTGEKIISLSCDSEGCQDLNPTAVCYSPDGLYIAGGFSNGLVRVWDANDTTAPYIDIERRWSVICSIGFSHNTEYVVSGSGAGLVRVWSWKSKSEEVKEFRGNSLSAMVVALSQDGQLVASANENGEIFVWNINTQNQLLRLSTGVNKLFSALTSIAFSPEETHVVVHASHGWTGFYDISNSKCKDTVNVPPDSQLHALHLPVLTPPTLFLDLETRWVMAIRPGMNSKTPIYYFDKEYDGARVVAQAFKAYTAAFVWSNGKVIIINCSSLFE